MRLFKLFILSIFLFPNNTNGQENNNSTTSECYQIISGFVRDKDTQEIIEDASIALYQNDKFITNSLINPKGEYRFKANCESSYSIVGNKLNYATKKREFNTSNVNKVKVNLTLYLKKENSTCENGLRGRITNDQSQPIENATVIINDESGKVIATEITNVSGNYHFNLLCNKKYNLIASKENFITETLTLKSNNVNKDLNRVDISMKSNLDSKEIGVYAKSNNCKRIINGHIFDKVDETFIKHATITLINDSNVKISSRDVEGDGTFNFDANCNSNYKILVTANGYKDTTVSIMKFQKNSVLNLLRIGIEPIKKNITEDNKEVVKLSELEIEKNLYTTIQETNINSTIPRVEVKNIEFDLNEIKINRKISIELNKLVKMMSLLPEINLFLKSHTDSQGPDEYNLALTEARAQSMVSYIISKGIDSNRVSGKGYGEKELVNECDNDNKCEKKLHRQNRRIEYIINKGNE